MRRTWFALLLMGATAAHAAGPAENVRAPFAEGAGAIAAVEKLGGVVKRDDKLAGSPVVEINLTFSYAPPLRPGDLRPLAAFPHLRTLEVVIDRLTPAMVADLRYLKSVKSLTLHISDCSGLDPNALTQLDSLDGLGLCGQGITDGVLNRVVGLASDSAPAAAGGRAFGGMRREAALPRLKSLSLRGTSVTDAGLRQLAAMRRLERLDLCYNPKLTEAAVRQIARLKQLKGLSLEQPGLVTDATLTDLTALTALEDLRLYGAGITDAGMKEVLRFTHLSKVSLSAGEVTDAGLMELVELKQLKRVFVFPGARTTDDGIGKLTQALGGRAEVTRVVPVINQVPCD